MSQRPVSGGGRTTGRNYANPSQSRRQKSEWSSAARTQRRIAGDEFDNTFGYSRYQDGPARLGWLLDMNATTQVDEDNRERSGLDIYFLQQDGETFKVTLFYQPYFYVGVANDRFIPEVTQLLQRKFDSVGLTIEACDKQDLDMPNHLAGRLHRFLKLSFLTVNDLMEVRSVLLPLIMKNQKRTNGQDAFNSSVNGISSSNGALPDDVLETLVDIREYDVPYVIRVAIDKDLRVGAWYDVKSSGLEVRLEWQKDMLEKAEPRVLAFDIECTKAPLKFPDATVDQVFMISYMIDGQGYLLISREVVSEDVEDFEYTPKPQYHGPFHVENLDGEEALLRRFISHIQELKPQIFVTYNGDNFDWPFIETRMRAYGIDMSAEIGVSEQQGEYRGRCTVHLDAFHWVKRDSYLPQGAQGLKSVTKYKLGYDPVEVDAEDMVRFASERPTEMASYSVSDAVATYYLYTTYVHNFIFSLCTIIPMKAEDVLRKGSGTLCETLLMVEAFRGDIICPNKHGEAIGKFYKGHLLETETYVGGHVECLETGVYRADLDYKFRMVPSALQQLIDKIDRDLKFAVEVEGGAKIEDVVDYAEVKAKIVARLADLRDNPNREEPPLIYHLDVGAMYPNIILTNRLQPSAIVDQAVCAACDFNQASNNCKRAMRWVWRGEYLPATRAEYEVIATQLAYERVNDQPFAELPESMQVKKIKDRLKVYSQRVYKRVRVTSEEERLDTVCMRENPFYVNTVRAFRDRRYEYKVLTKKWKNAKADAEAAGDSVARKVAEDKETVFDSLQLAHKCILNSFYGYVMRKGARWRSMEMAGIVTDTGARLITEARELMEQIGRPLELDTDGIWCILPKSFPENFTMSTAQGKCIKISYPCVMLNADVHDRYTNHQYQELMDPASMRYETRSECSIFFEVDGPYRCMVLPASTEEGKLLKKRYAVFNLDGSLAELKGFELKRRGELELIKAFQSQVFEYFLRGETLEECYESVAEIANYWLDVLDSRGEDLEDEEVMELISENKTISKTLEEYGDQKGTSLTTAARLGDFLGPDMVKDKGLNCRLVIANRPHGAPVTERAIPTAIFSTEPAIRRHFLRKWLKDPGLHDLDIRSIIDWDYYKERLGKTIQKIITIPAAMQKVKNPVPRVDHPDWLGKKVRELTDGYRQLKISSMFQQQKATTTAEGDGGRSVSPTSIVDIEDMLEGSTSSPQGITKKSTAIVRRVVQSGSTTGDKGGKPTPDAPAVPAKCPPITKDFTGWLRFRKAQWRAQRLERRQSRGLISHGSARVGSRRAREEGKGPETGKRHMNVESFLKNATMAVTHGFWQVIEVRETEIPGEYVIWAMTGQKSLQRLSLSIDRLFYVASNDDNQADFARLDAKKVSRFLPHNMQSPFVFELTSSERHFQRNEDGVASLLSRPGVTGVYELQTPLWLRAMMQLGCVAQVSRQRRSQGLDRDSRSFQLADMEFVSSSSHPYLHPSVAVFRHIYIYQSMSGRRGLVAIFIPTGDNTDFEAETEGALPVNAVAEVWLVNPFSRTEARPPLQRIFGKYASAGDFCKFRSSYVDSMTTALALLHSSLSDYLQERNGPTVVLAQTATVLSILRRQVPTLNDMPVVMMPSNADDNRYPALGWQQYSSQRMIQRFLFSPGWFRERLQAARYSNLPVGNISHDPQRMIADVTFARLLKHNRYILWASESTKPDLGGCEGDENEAWSEEAVSPVIRFPGAYREICIEFDLHGLAVNSVMASAELEALEGSENLFSQEVKSFQDTSGPEGGATSIHTSKANVDDGSCAAAFRLLKLQISNWLRDLATASNIHADGLLVHFYRWLCDPDSLMYDPALRRLIHKLMEKVFMRLIAEFRRLGARVIFANFNRAVIATSKADIAAAREYADFVINTVISRDIFKWLQILPSKYWEQLIFLDEENYGGVEFHEQVPSMAIDQQGSQESQQGDSQIAADTTEKPEAAEGSVKEDTRSLMPPPPPRLPSHQKSQEGEDGEEDEDATNTTKKAGGRRRIMVDEEEEEEEDGQQEGDSEDEEEGPYEDDDVENDDQQGVDPNAPRLLSHWNLGEFLPPACREYFLLMVAEFLYRPREKERELRAQREMLVMKLSGQFSDDADEENKMMSHEETIRQLQEADKEHDQVMTRFMQNLVSGFMTNRMMAIIQEVKTYLHGPEAFPEQVGSFRRLTNPALELVKSVCHILSLDPRVEHQVEVMRRLLLTQVGVREFSDDGMFKDFCRSFVLPDLICTFCNFCQDLDLCRDPGLTCEDEDDRWRCPDCHNLYDVARIEQQLVELVERRSTRYNLQDVRCVKCKRVGQLLMASNCKCSGRLVCDETSEKLEETLHTLRRVALFHKLDWLQETVERMLRVMPSDQGEEEGTVMAS